MNSHIFFSSSSSSMDKNFSFLVFFLLNFLLLLLRAWACVCEWFLFSFYFIIHSIMNVKVCSVCECVCHLFVELHSFRLVLVLYWFGPLRLVWYGMWVSLCKYAYTEIRFPLNLSDSEIESFLPMIYTFFDIPSKFGALYYRSKHICHFHFTWLQKGLKGSQFWSRFAIFNEMSNIFLLFENSE